MSDYLTHLPPCDEIMQTMERIYRYRMTTTSGGNLSLLDDDGSIWITPARVDKGSLRREDIVCVRTSGSIEGLHKPSSEFPFHDTIYKARRDIRGIVHAHAVALVAFSITGQVPDTRLFHQSRHVCGEVGFAPYALPGSAKLGENIADTFAKGFDCVVLENHGVAVGGESLQQAFQKFETLEFTAKTIIKARLLGDVRYLSDEEIDMAHQIPLLETFEREQPPISKEKELRRQICAFTQRGYQQRLFISTGGSFSARLDENSFLITPYQVDRRTLNLDDIVLVKNGRSENGKRPSRASRNHQAIYERHTDVNSILNASSVNATAFSVTAARLDSRTIPESYILLRDVGRVPYAMQFQEPAELAKQISMTNPIALLDNGGVLVVGASVLETFDRLEVLESTAEALINSRLIGDVAAMPDGVIDELKRVFLAA